MEEIMSYVIVPVSPEISAAVRRTRLSPHYGHPALQERAQGYGPCRSCLQTFRVGEEDRPLFTLDPFRENGTLPAPGPIFIHHDDCARHESAGFPPGLVGLPLLVEGYDRFGLPLVRRELVWPEPDAAIDAVWSEPNVAFAHLRNAEAGCFVARVERRPGPAPSTAE
jgi:hypothetical protein